MNQRHIGVDDVTIYLLENNRVEPSIRLIPKIIEYLGHDPQATKSESLGEKMRYFRRVHGLSQKKLARLLEIDQSSIGNWERGENQPTKRNFEKILIIIDPGIDNSKRHFF